MNANPMLPQTVPQTVPPQGGTPGTTPMATPVPAPGPMMEGEAPGMEEAPGPMIIPGTEPPQPAPPDLPQPRVKPTSMSSRPWLGAPEALPEGRPQLQRWDSIMPAAYVPTQPR
jgi:hypothetical protein